MRSSSLPRAGTAPLSHCRERDREWWGLWQSGGPATGTVTPHSSRPLPDRDVHSVRLRSPSSRAGRNLDVSTPAQLSLVFFAKSIMQLIQILAGRRLGPAECELRKIKKRIGISQMFHRPGPGHLVKCRVERKCQSIRCFFFFFLSFLTFASAAEPEQLLTAALRGRPGRVPPASIIAAVPRV